MRESLGIVDISMKFVPIFQFPKPPLHSLCSLLYLLSLESQHLKTSSGPYSIY